jgi:hypothetical protein
MSEEPRQRTFWGPFSLWERIWFFVFLIWLIAVVAFVISRLV